ncbi:MAG: universal stress protein [Arenibacter sp.]|jgi:nucleotide-binding universal stress UspA family protein|uniref:universal stress protein n=1 Tax=Arenibacter TaxID=178469 RepID=UPI0008539640|nr:MULTISPECIES: universal stress protein [Arenibacter]MCM4151992.1 universal stress protein [Arenibacter sp. N53]GBF20603.1 putative universal stress protein [Arenibacter sp. NBRC 103722]|tara:strand:+ start:3276 stop:3722 length:447 start_codon:yes stop_codon:yes gene_type:complete
MKIVLAIDGSDYSKIAVNELGAMPLPAGTEVCILNVFENPMLAVPMGGTLGNYYEEAISNARNSAEAIVNDASKLLKIENNKLSISTVVVNGIPKSAILEKAEAFDADLIVVGSQGHGAFSRFLLGSVSQSLATHADCSVLIVRKRSI